MNGLPARESRGMLCPYTRIQRLRLSPILGLLQCSTLGVVRSATCLCMYRGENAASAGFLDGCSNVVIARVGGDTQLGRERAGEGSLKHDSSGDCVVRHHDLVGVGNLCCAGGGFFCGWNCGYGIFL